MPPTESDIPMHGWKPYSDMHRERIRAHAKFGHTEQTSTEGRSFYDARWLAILTEEVGEVARVLNEWYLGNASLQPNLRKELIQVGAMVAAWVDAIDMVKDW